MTARYVLPAHRYTAAAAVRRATPQTALMGRNQRAVAVDHVQARSQAQAATVAL
jgi:hypothetical protein